MVAETVNEVSIALSVVSLTVAVISLVFAVLRTRAASRSADAAERSAGASEKSAGLAEMAQKAVQAEGCIAMIPQSPIGIEFCPARELSKQRCLIPVAHRDEIYISLDFTAMLLHHGGAMPAAITGFSATIDIADAHLVLTWRRLHMLDDPNSAPQPPRSIGLAKGACTNVQLLMADSIPRALLERFSSRVDLSVALTCFVQHPTDKWEENVPQFHAILTLSDDDLKKLGMKDVLAPLSCYSSGHHFFPVSWMNPAQFSEYKRAIEPMPDGKDGPPPATHAPLTGAI